MNLLYEPPAKEVAVGGSEYRIYTGFRDWLRFFDMQDDSNISQRDKLIMMLEWYIDKPPLDKLEQAIDALIAFATRRDDRHMPEAVDTGNKSTDKMLSWSYDAAYVYAAFLSVYNIDLLSIKDMHWHVFMALFDALPEDTPIKQRIGYRAVNLASIKDKNERARIKKIQDKIRIPHDDVDAYQCGEFFG